jgi:Tol biopolymer transport system component/DNA-binding winged helix-turn-helix (wHTH) protein
MEKTHLTERLVRFGLFELDLRAGELRKNGVKIKLQEQPFQILAMLLESPGEIVTREELQRKLWSNDTFVDFDNSLNKAINKIRESLGDSADNPRFVETMARRGYRFIAPVEGSLTDVEALKAPVAAPASPRRWRLVMTIGLGVVLVIASVGVTWWLMKSSPPAPKHILTRLTSDTGLTTDPALSPDGKLLAYASDRSGKGNLDIWVKQVAGGDPLRLTYDAADDKEPSFSPDGSQIAFRSEREGGGIYVISSLGGDERLISKDGFGPRFSPDGPWILYGNSYHSYVVPSSGGAPRRLEPDFELAVNPIWVPDAKHVLFVGIREKVPMGSANVLDWWVAPLDGGAAINTGAAKAFKQAGLSFDYSFDAVWSSKGDQVGFTAQHGDTRNVWQIPISTKTWQVTGEPQQLTFGTGLEGHPSLTTDGRLVFSSVISNFDIWSLPLDASKGKVSGEMQRLTRNAGEDVAFDLSEDGRKLLFLSNRSGNDDVWLKDLDSGKERPVTVTPSNEIWPKMTADGSKVSYAAFDENGKDIIYVLPVGGGVPEKMCEDCAGPWQWSPDGESLLYRIPGDWDSGIGLFNLKSGKKTVLLKHPKKELLFGQFSPDNRWIAFSVNRSLFVARFRGEEELNESEWIALPKGGWPRWSPDGNLLYFISDRDGFSCFWAQRLEPATKHPVGSAFPVYHFHLAQLPLHTLEPCVARDKIVFTLRELTGNIWMTTLKQ